MVELNVMENEPNTICLQLNGRLDTSNYETVMERLKEIDFSGKKVLLDLRDLVYISSAGLRVILALGKKLGAERLRIINLSEDVYDVFKTTGFTSIFQIDSSQNVRPTHLIGSFKELLARKVKHQGSKVFIYEGDRTYTWDEIEKCSQIIASDLSRAGVQKGTHVGLCSANSANWVLTFFAIQKLGAFACLLNFNYNSKEIRNVAQVGDITHFCYGEIPAMKDADEFLDMLKADNGSIQTCYDIRQSICFKDRMEEYDSVKGLFRETVEQDSACVMIYTSGSTGVPKGVLLSAYNILNAAGSMADIIHLNENDKLCLILPLFHIFGMTAGFFSNVIFRGSICIPPNIRTDTLLRVISEEKCTLFHSVPTMILALMNNAGFDRAKTESLRCIIMAGAPTTEAQIKLMRDNFPSSHLICAYGLSEIAPVSMTSYDDSIEHISKTVGKPVPYIHLEIQHPNTGLPCAEGEIGEVVVEGYNLMVCYYKASMDVQSLDEHGWLHTGDLGYLDSEGYLHLTGRAKELIIRGGENIMPNEVASAISEHPGIADVKVVGIPDDFYGESVCACLCMKEGASFNEAEMRDFLRDRLAKYKIPSNYLVYDELPTLSNGKVDMVGLRKDAIGKIVMTESKPK